MSVEASASVKRQTNSNEDQVEKKRPKRVIDTGGGFLLEAEEDVDRMNQPVKLVHPPGPLLETSGQKCEDCGRNFTESYLLKHYDVEICDECRDSEEKHRLITKTEAKKRYLLKDADFDSRDPPLKFILRKNPRNDKWGDMKLYLELQVAQRAHVVWESDEKLDEAHEQRAANRERLKQKQFDKKIKQLRMAARSSLYTRNLETHQHQYGDEICVDADEDLYSKTCSTCGHTVQFEKM